MTHARFAFLVGWLFCSWTTPASAVLLEPPVTFPVTVNGETVGEIEMGIDSFGLGGGVRGPEGVTGKFTVTKTKARGGVMSLAELEAYLGQHHLNWFQMITRDTHPANDKDGTPLTPPHVDPPSGGYNGPGTTKIWADGRPWYWNETAKPVGEPRDDAGQLSDHSTASVLEFADYPTVVDANGPVSGAEINFATFLISDYGNHTYSVLGGFTWGIKTVTTPVNGPNGKPLIVTNVTGVTQGAEFKDSYRDAIATFGYTQVPEPGTLVLLGLGSLIGLIRPRKDPPCDSW